MSHLAVKITVISVTFIIDIILMLLALPNGTVTEMAPRNRTQYTTHVPWCYFILIYIYQVCLNSIVLWCYTRID